MYSIDNLVTEGEIKAPLPLDNDTPASGTKQ